MIVRYILYRSLQNAFRTMNFCPTGQQRDEDKNMGALEGKVAVVTGGNSGIGRAIAKRFVEEGAYVYITARRQSELDKAVATIGTNVSAIAGDLSMLENIDRIAKTVRAEKGVVDVIVSNAGFTDQVALEEITLEHFDKTFNLMARAPVFLVQKLLPMMKSGGSIILVSSAMHQMGIANHTTYAATKAANRSYARTWAAEFKGRGIRVNTLSPGVTDTPILEAQSEAAGRDEVVKMYLNMIPLGRLAEAVEIANAAVFLGSYQSSYVTGADLMADGGVGQV
jgi:NAD(P)-dependent dehydrogenase (short-subunit alcohol dehydrogenase family)